MSTIARRLEWAIFVLLCLAVALAPLGAYRLLQVLPESAQWPPGRWSGGVYASWAVLIYFSWAFLPPIHAPAPERLRAWGWFLLLELAYPTVSWILGPEDGAFLAADTASYASSAVALGAGLALVAGIVRGLRDPDAWLWMPPALAITVFLLLVPAAAIEVLWWQVAGLADGGWGEPVLRVAGLAAGTAGVLANLRRMQ
jgi:hypothetical protein